MRSILVTGAAGFIGRALITRLLELGSIVVGIDNINDSYNISWKKDNLKKNTHKNFYFYEEDILNKNHLEQIIKNHNPQIIVHLAARTGIRASIENPILYQKVNVEGTLNLLEIAKNYKTTKFIFASSSSVYGNQTKIPFSENDIINAPISPYAATKIAGELLLKTYSHLYKMKSICLRFFTVYGPGGRPDMAPYIFTKSILNGIPINKYGDGNTKRDYTYIDDIIEGIISALEYDCVFDIFNLGNSNPVTLNNFIYALESISGKKAIIKQLPMQAGDALCTYADINKSSRLLNYNPRIPLETGLERFISWFQQNR